MRVLVTRPQPEAGAFAARLAAAGHEALVDPVIRIHEHPDALPDLGAYGGLVFTSANGVRAFAAATPTRALPVFAVGTASGAAARAAGFAKVAVATGDVTRLGDLIVAASPAGRLLHIAGEIVAGDLAGRLAEAGIALDRAVLYEARPATALGGATRAALEPGAASPLDAVTFFSPRTAVLFGELLAGEGLGLAATRLAAICLSAAVADAARAPGYARIAIAARPTAEAMLDALAGA